MTQSMPIASTPIRTAAAASRYDSLDLASLLGDSAARAGDDGRRRIVACPPFPAEATPQVCVAAWHGVLHWLSYNDDPITTCLVGRRAHAGCPIVTSAGAETSLAQLLAEVRAQWPQADEDWLDLRDPAHAELLNAVRCQSIRLDAPPEKNAPELALIRDGSAWHSACACVRYSEDYQRSLMALWHRFVAALVERPHALLSEQTHGDGASETHPGMAGPSMPIAGNLALRFAAQAAAWPDKPAVIDDLGSIDFAELAALSDAWAAALRDAGVRDGDYVGLAFGRGGGRFMVAAQLAVLKTGAAFVPMDATQPAARLQAMAEDTDMRLALAEAPSAPALLAAMPGVQCLVADSLPATPDAAVAVQQAAGIDDPAYVIFTSGSTGKPKGVKVSHGNLLNFVTHLEALVASGDVVSQFAPFTFDASVAEIHASVLNGATLVILSGELINDPDRLQAYMHEQGVTFAAFPPQYAQHLSPAKLPGLRTLLTAGSAPDHALVARWQPHVRYINAYGPTETTILSTAWQPSRVPGRHEPIVIGTPISNTQVRVTNRFNQSLPHGVIGELLIGGEGVTHGYLKREDLTRERFVTLDGTRWYRSGDLASLDADGRLVFAGRVDNQVKLRGHRLEPGEVETALLAVDGIRQAAVAVTGDAPATKQLVGFCVGTAMPEDALRQRLLQLLPAWALPNRIVWIDSLPVTRNGKTDYARLVADLAQARTQAEDAAPVAYADELEAQVAAIWRGVLQQPCIGPDDSFIHLGGDSLTSLVVTSAIRRLGYAASSSQLLQHPRLADYVQLLRTQGRRSVERDYASHDGPAPLAPIQGWFFSLGLSHPGTFCQSLVFDSDERIDVERLAHAGVRLAAYHDQLRARFVFDAAANDWRQDITPLQLVLSNIEVIEIADALLDAASQSCCRRLAAELRLDAAPLFRLAVIQSPQRSRVVWVLHHLLVDTVSHGILLDDLHQLYCNPAQPVRQVLPGKSSAFGAWAGRLQQRVAADTQRLLAPWRPILDAVGQAQPLPLAQDRGTTAPVVVCEARLSRDETKQLVEDATQCFHQTPEDLVLAATYRALARTLGLQRLAIDVEWHGRDDTDAGPQGLDRTVGWFTSVHPLCMPVTPDEPLGPWLMALKEARAAVPNRGREFYALRYLSRDADARAAFAGYRQPDVLFNFSGVVQRSPGAWRTVPIDAIEMGDGNANPYALSVETEIRDGELVVSCHSRPELWPAGAVNRLAFALSEDLREIVRYCCDAGHRRWTPSDFTQLALTQAQADELPLSIRAAYPLTDMQQTMCRHPDTYQVFMSYRMPRRFEAGPWTRAVGEWIARHDCLRTFVKEWDGGVACQVVLDTLPQPMTVHQVARGRAKALADELIEQGRRGSVRLDQAPLFHLHAMDEGQDDFLIVLSIHHLIHDGWSIDLLLADLLQAYRHACGEDCPKPGAALAGVADIVALQARLRASAQWQAYWAGLPWQGSASQLPCTVRRAESGVAPGARRNMQLHLGAIDPALAAAVRARADELGVTINSLWLAGYAALLRTLGGQAQVRCGVIQSGRSEEIPGVETITGCCVNTLPLVLDVPSTQTLGGIVADVNGQLERMREAAGYPLSAIHEAVKSRLDDEVFSTLFNIESRRYGERADEVRPVLEGGYESTNHDFIFGLIEQHAQVTDADAAVPRYQVRIGYDADRYDAASVAGWLEIYAHCMGLLAAQADVPWNALQLLPARMRDQVLTQWNRTEHPYRQDCCIHELVSEQVIRTPEAIALVAGDQHLSYRELDERANRLAQHLQALGVGPDVVVGCCFERSIEMVVGLLGVLKAGGAYVPLDPELPAQRLGAMVADIGTRVVLTQDALVRGPLSHMQAQVQLLRLDADWPQIAVHGATPPESGVGPGHLAYVIFTSGSTGKPKAAMNEHGAVVNRLQWMQDTYRLDGTDRVLQKTPFSFDVSVWEFFWPLLAGATLVMARPGGHREPAYLSAVIREQRITTLHFVPSMLQVFVDEGGLGACAGVRRVITSGEGLPGALAARFLAQPSAELHNLYGPTEAAIDVSSYHVRQAAAGTEPIGRPIWNTRLYVLDERLQPVPVGVGGELYIGGLAVGRGYLGREDLTAERFLASPFVAGERLYRTGDLARWRADGELEYLGRTDHQVKIRGFRIELGEIEHALCAQPEIRQALVTVREDQGRKQLVAYVVAQGHDDTRTSALIRELVDRLHAVLPEYMVPAAIVVMDALPLNANGKVDRARLPEPGPAAQVRELAVEPASDDERALWAIWKDVLGHAAFGVTDSFFALGGDSISAIQVASRAARLGLAVQPRQIIEEKTIRKLAAKLVRPAAAAPSTAPAANPTESACKGEQRLLPIQLQFLHDDRTDMGQYNQYAEIGLPAHADEAALGSALRALVARHDVLRLRFRETNGTWMAQYRTSTSQQIDDMLITVDLAALPAEQHAAAVANATAQAHASLDIKQGRLCKWVWVRGAADARLVWIMHHLVVDGVSWRVLVNDLHTVLSQCGRGETPSLRAGTDSYQTWAARLHDHAFSPSLEREKDHWRRQLALAAPDLRLDADGADLEEHTDVVEATLDARATERLLHEAPLAHGTPAHRLLIAALARALGQWLDSDAVRLALEGHGREPMEGEAAFERLDISETVGWFTTLYPVHLSGLRAALAAQIATNHRELEAVPNNGIGYGLLCHVAHDEELEAARERMGFRESQVLFNYLGQFGPGERGGSFVSPRRRRSHALRINAWVQDGVLRLRFDHSREQLRHETVAGLADRFTQVLHEMIEQSAGGHALAPAATAPATLVSPAIVAPLRAKHPALQDVYPCTGMQEGLLLFTTRQPKSGVYVTQMQMTLEGVDPARLRGSWQTLMARHAILRTAFADVGESSMLQLVMAEAELPWLELDLRGNEAELPRSLEAERERPFDIGAAPLMRLLLARTGDQRYVLAWTYHHALIDGWSMACLLKDLLEIHAGSATPQARGPSWRDYIEWLLSRDREAAARYWRGCFDGVDIGASATLPVSTRTATSAARRPLKQKAHTVELSAPATEQLVRLARGEGVSLGTLMLAAWGLLLSKYNAEPQVLFGYTSSGRPPALPDIEHTAGLFINSLPMCLRIDGGQTLSAWLADIQRVQLDHEDHGHLPLADIQRHAGVQPGQSMFDSLVVVENYPLDRSALSADSHGGLRVLDVQGVERNGFGLTLVVYPGERLTLKLVYQAQKFDDAVTSAMLGQLSQLLAGFADGGRQTVSQVSILSPAERERAVHGWNDTAVGHCGERTISDLFEAQAVVRGPAPALVNGSTRWSYAQLAHRVASISAWLQQQGVQPGDKVALSLDKGPDLVAAMLGILRAGAAYVPIAIDCPLDRRAFIAADAGIRQVVTRAGHAPQIAVPGVHALLLEDCPDRAPAQVAGKADIPDSSQATAYVIYTSGTTGTPKGVSISHRNLVNFCAWCMQAARCGAGDRITQFAPYTFDASAGEIFGTLIAGAELHLLADTLIQDSRALAKYLCDHDIRFAAFPPSYVQQMEPQQVPPTLTLLTAGSAPTPELVKRWGARCRYINGYGPTETTILSSAWVCERGEADGRELSIGRPIANTTMYVVDRVGQLCAPGLVGEIWIGGDGVAQGYVNRPELTAQQFIADPFRPGGRVYRTGDLGRWREDGCIEFVGRRDRQVKLRGFRIELGEIEARIREHTQVKEAAVLVRGVGADQQLLAWVVPAPGVAPSPEWIGTLRAFIRRALPDYMLPQAITPLEAMPVTANGKLDDKALPSPEAGERSANRHVATRTAAETRLAGIWGAVLKIRPEQISAKASFFELGGHSLLAMRVMSRLREESGLEIGVADLFANPVLADLAAMMDGLAQPALPRMERVARDKPLALSFAQNRLWFLDQMEGVSRTYQIPGALRLRGRLDEAALRCALDRIVARHEVLRTTFHAVDGEPAQRIGPEDAGFRLEACDLSGRPDAEQELRRVMDEAIAAPFDLATGPLVHGRLIRLRPEEHVLLILMHHIVMDGWSLSLLLQELAALYGAHAAGADDPLPPLALQYADYAAWQQQWLTGATWQEQCDYWRRTLAGAPPLLELPTDRQRPVQQDYAGGLVDIGFDAGMTAQLKALSRRHGTTLFMTLLAAWSVVLARLSGQQDLVVGTPMANRGQLETEPMIGFFVNPLALRLDLSGNPTLSELLQRVKTQVLDAQRYQQLPFEQVVEIAQPPRSLAHTPVFQVMLNWQDQGLDGFALEGLQATPMRPPGTLSKYDLTLDVGEAGDRIAGVFEYATALFDAATVKRHGGYLQRVVRAMLADMEQPVQSLDLLADDERLALQAFNDTARPELCERCWMDLFDEQAARTPERIAVRCAGAQLSYGELHERATRVAAVLVDAGAGPGEVVALLDQRGIDLLVMIVAVLKSGAAYMPLDPAHPPQRWLDILAEAQPLLLWVGDSLATEQRWLRRKWTDGTVAGTADLVVSPPPAAGALPRPSLVDLAYVLFTSGSTGKPKGVMIEHRGMVNNMRSKFEPLGLGADDVIAQTASQCFDISVWQFLTALLLGGRVLIAGDELTRDPEALLEHLAAEQATVWEPVPSVMQAALAWRKPLPTLRWVMPTGEALSRELVARWFEQYPGIPLMNAYGPAECSDDVALQPIHGPVERVLIGRPVANAQLHVVDEQLMLLPLGAVGELAVAGAVVGRGYIGRPEETRAAFMSNPHALRAGEQRLYLTGDLVRRWPDGCLEYIGRKDFQVKVRGFRIELGEIESCLARHPAVREAIVAARERAPGDPQLVAYVTLDEPVCHAGLQAHLRAQLPDYMLPAAIVVLDALPLNANGKVDRKALPEPTEAAYARAEYEPPRGDTERAIASLWQELLQLPQVGRDDSYFDLGGSSLLLIRMLSRLNDLGLTLGVTEVYQLRTVSACAAAIDARQGGAAGWPLDDTWRHAIVALDDGTGRSALLLDRSERARHQALQALLAALEPTRRPAFVRYADDLAAMSRQIASVGVAALAAVQSEIKLVQGFRGLLQRHRQALAGAAVETHLPFSPIQRNLLPWRSRDSVDMIELHGWHTAPELQQAFAEVAAEQDMLRAAADESGAQWRLLAADTVAATAMPAVDLRGHDPARHADLLECLSEELLAARKTWPLAHVAALVSLSDVEHRLLLAVDHLVWDGLSAPVLQQRLQHRLLGGHTGLERNYRDYADAAWRAPTDHNAALLAVAIDRDDLAETMAATRQVLARRAQAPVQSLQLRVPLAAAGGTPADQAFCCFKRCVEWLTGLRRYGVLLNHHGRESGGERWFEQVGLFLDKVPFAVDPETPLKRLAFRAQLLQRLGINYLGLAQAAGSGWGSTLPPLEYEVLFNFQADAPRAHVPSDGGILKEKLKDFRGILFEAAAGADGLEVHCAFRGDAAEAEAVGHIAAGEDPHDTIVMLRPPAPVLADAVKPSVAVPVHALEVRDVRKRYGEFEAVKGVSFSVRRGCCFGILGPNGAGKTSLLAMIEGIVPITSGSIRLLGMDVGTQIDRIQPHVGVQLQQNNYFQFLTVAELLSFYQQLRSAVGGKRRGQAVAALLERLDLKDKLDFKVDQLSGGQKQRLSIAIALLEDPDVIFLDEPTSALDPHSRIATWEFIEDLKKDPRKTIILTTHYMEEAERLCDEILLMDRGKVIAQGEPSRLVKSLAAQHSIQFQFGRGQFRPVLLEGLVHAQHAEWNERTDCLRLRTSQVTEAMRELLALSQEARIDMVNIEINRPTLEDVFLSHTGKELSL